MPNNDESEVCWFSTPLGPGREETQSPDNVPCGVASWVHNVIHSSWRLFHLPPRPSQITYYITVHLVSKDTLTTPLNKDEKSCGALLLAPQRVCHHPTCTCVRVHESLNVPREIQRRSRTSALAFADIITLLYHHPMRKKHLFYLLRELQQQRWLPSPAVARPVTRPCVVRENKVLFAPDFNTPLGWSDHKRTAPDAGVNAPMTQWVLIARSTFTGSMAKCESPRATAKVVQLSSFPRERARNTLPDFSLLRCHVNIIAGISLLQRLAADVISLLNSEQRSPQTPLRNRVTLRVVEQRSNITVLSKQLRQDLNPSCLFI